MAAIKSYQKHLDNLLIEESRLVRKTGAIDQELDEINSTLAAMRTYLAEVDSIAQRAKDNVRSANRNDDGEDYMFVDDSVLIAGVKKDLGGLRAKGEGVLQATLEKRKTALLTMKAAVGRERAGIFLETETWKAKIIQEEEARKKRIRELRQQRREQQQQQQQQQQHQQQQNHGIPQPQGTRQPLASVLRRPEELQEDAQPDGDGV